MRWTVIAALMLTGCGFLSTISGGSSVQVDVDEDVEDPPECEPLAWYPDGDGDTHGDPDRVVWACEAPANTVALGDDCDDRDPATRPGADERCDGKDQDCNGLIDDDAVDPTAYFADGDGDGFGSTPLGASCEAPAGASERGNDCNDSDAAVYPGASEPVCTTVDLNCDGRAGFAAVQGATPYDTIQEAIDAAPERGQVLVCPGERVESLTLSRGISLASTTGKLADVRITAPAGERVIQGSGGSVSLRGLTLAGTTRTEVQQGGIISLQSNVLDIEDCRLENGRAGGQGGAIWWRGQPSSRGAGASFTMLRVVVAKNRAGTDGGALYLEPKESGGVRFDQVTFRHNVAGQDGGAVFAEELVGSAVTWNASASIDNEAARGGALYTVSSGAGSATSVLSSTSTDDTGGAFVSGRRLVLDDVVIQRATGGPAAQASRLNAVDVTIEDSAPVAFSADELTVEDSALFRNAMGARAADDLRFTNVDVGSGPNANDGDVQFAGRTFNFAGTIDARCSGSGCVEL